MQHIGNDDDLDVLTLNREEWLGDQSFEDAFVFPIACKEGFIGEQNDAIAQVFVEPANELFGGDNLQAVLSEDLGEPSAKCALSAAFYAAEDERDLGGLMRALDSTSGPIEDVIRPFGDAAAQHLLDMSAHQAPGTEFGFDGEATS